MSTFRGRLAIVLAAFMLCSMLVASAQTAPAGDSSTKLTRPVNHYTLPPDKLAKSTALHNTRIRMFVIDTIYGFGLLLLYLYAGWAVGFRNLAERVSKNSFAQAWIFVPLLLVSLDVLNLPPAIYGHHLSVSYGLSVQHWGSWFADWGKSVGLQVIGGSLIIWLLYLIIRRSPRRWWLYFWLATLPIMAFVVFISPVVLEPMFDKFQPLDKTNPVLVTKIEELAHHAGLDIPRKRIFEMKASAKTTELNAYVTGYGATKRVVIWNTTEEKLTIPQTLFVVGHEMGHYVLGHIWKGMLFGAFVLFFVFYVGFRFSLWLIRRVGPRWKIRDIGDWASLPALILVVSILSFMVDPIANGFSRVIEHHADIFGLEVTHGIVPDSNESAAQAFQVLGETSLTYPYPNRFMVFWFADHPPIPDRLLFALHYKPWDEGKPMRFVK